MTKLLYQVELEYWYKRFGSCILILVVQRKELDHCAYSRAFGYGGSKIVFFYATGMLIVGDNKDATAVWATFQLN